MADLTLKGKTVVVGAGAKNLGGLRAASPSTT
jgi:hypothetical protein